MSQADSTVPSAAPEHKDHRPTPWGQNRDDRAALLRLIRELENLLEGAPDDDPDVAGLRKDIEHCKRITSWIGNAPIVTPGLRA